jgi:peptidoglycan-N-acetylglucosamine deacetylase
MRRGWMYFFMFVFLFLFDSPEVSLAASNTKKVPIAVNDQFVSFPDAVPIIENNTTYVPVRYFSDAIGATMIVEQTKIISIEWLDKFLMLNMNLNEIQFSDGTNIKVELFIRNGRTYVPLRILGEYFGYQVQYLAEGPIVRLVNSADIIDRQHFLKANHSKIIEFYQKKLIVDKRPKVYLTFDDGPNPGIQDILDILKKKQAKASFFMIETQMRKFPNDIKRLVKEGHYPALHSVSHNKNLLYEGKPIAVANEMVKSQKTLFQITGIQSDLTRAPYGSKPYMTKAFRDEMAKQKFKMWDWDIDSLDWKYRSNPNLILKNVKESFQEKKKQKDEIVILFHINSGTVAVLPEVIDFIHAQGYQCVAYNPAQHVVVNFWKDKRL